MSSNFIWGNLTESEILKRHLSTNEILKAWLMIAHYCSLMLTFSWIKKSTCSVRGEKTRLIPWSGRGMSRWGLLGLHRYFQRSRYPSRWTHPEKKTRENMSKMHLKYNAAKPKQLYLNYILTWFKHVNVTTRIWLNDFTTHQNNINFSICQD